MEARLWLLAAPRFRGIAKAPSNGMAAFLPGG